MNDLRLVVFDCDGTLVDSLQMITQTMHAAYLHHGYEMPDTSHIRQIIGLSLEVAIAELTPDFSVQQCEDVAASYRHHFHALRKKGDMIEPLFDQARETLVALEESGFLLGVATGKGIRGLNHVLELHDLTHFFTTLQTPDIAPGKPHPGMLENAMEVTGARPENTVMIGDTSFDIEMAVNAGVHPVGVAWGYHEVDELKQAGATAIVTQMTDLHSALDVLL